MNFSLLVFLNGLSPLVNFPTPLPPKSQQTWPNYPFPHLFFRFRTLCPCAAIIPDPSPSGAYKPAIWQWFVFPRHDTCFCTLRCNAGNVVPSEIFFAQHQYYSPPPPYIAHAFSFSLFMEWRIDLCSMILMFCDAFFRSFRYRHPHMSKSIITSLSLPLSLTISPALPQSIG